MFPQAFIDDLRSHADIVQVIQEYVTLRKSGATYKGLCPFHSEKSPSFHVNHDKGFFHCFGCGVGGDVFKFLELQEKWGFRMPSGISRGNSAFRFRSRWAAPSPSPTRPSAKRSSRCTSAPRSISARSWTPPPGTQARRLLRDRGITADTIKKLGMGFAPPGNDGLKAALLKEGLGLPLLLRSGLVVERDNGQAVDRFRGRLMIPIARDSGSIVAFGGRAMRADQQPKYLNSPETSIYTKGRTLYGLHLTKKDIAPPGLRGDGGGLLRFRAAGPGGHRPGGGLLGDGPHPGAGPAAPPLHVKGDPELRPRRRGPGRRGAILRAAGGRRLRSERGRAAAGRRSRYC